MRSLTRLFIASYRCKRIEKSALAAKEKKPTEEPNAGENHI